MTKQCISKLYGDLFVWYQKNIRLHPKIYPTQENDVKISKPEKNEFKKYQNA